MNIVRLAHNPAREVRDGGLTLGTTYFPTRDIETIELIFIIEAIRWDDSMLLPVHGAAGSGSKRIAGIMRRVDGAIDSVLEKAAFK